METKPIEKKQKKQPLISADEFRKLFGLDSTHIVTPTILNKFIKAIKGSWLYYDELYNMFNGKINKKFHITFDRKIYLYAMYKDSVSYQDFLLGYSSRPKIEVGYFHKNNIATSPFWTYTEFDGDNKRMVMNTAYDTFKNEILTKMQNKYSVKYGVHLKFRDFSRDNHAAIWLDNIEFQDILVPIKGKGLLKISSHTIRHVISNPNNVWPGKMPKPISKIISSLTKEE